MYKGWKELVGRPRRKWKTYTKIKITEVWRMVWSRFNWTLKGSDDRVSLRIAGFLDFIHRPEFWVLDNTTFRKTGSVSASGKGRVTPTLLVHWLRSAIFKGPNRVSVSLPPTADRNRSGFRNVVFSSISNSRQWKKTINPVIVSEDSNGWGQEPIAGFSQHGNEPSGSTICW
jgi:hypothetical protein